MDNRAACEQCGVALTSRQQQGLIFDLSEANMSTAISRVPWLYLPWRGRKYLSGAVHPLPSADHFSATLPVKYVTVPSAILSNPAPSCRQHG